MARILTTVGIKSLVKFGQMRVNRFIMSMTMAISLIFLVRIIRRLDKF